MKTIDKIITFAIIICILILATMGVVSAGSYQPSGGADAGVLYKPYAPIDYVNFTDNGSGVTYTLHLDDRFYAYPGYDSMGTERKLLVQLTGTDDTIYDVYLTVTYAAVSSGQYKVSFTLASSQLPGFGSSDGWYFEAYTDDFILGNSQVSNSYVPSFTLLGMSDSSTYSYYNSSTVNYYLKSGSGNSFNSSESYVWTRDAWKPSNITGFPLLFRYPEVYNNFSNLNSSTRTYASNGRMWINSSMTRVSSDYSISGVTITVPFVQADTIVPISSYLSYFDLGRYETNVVTQTVIHTVTVRPDIPSYEQQYTSFTDWLVIAVGGFMDFGFWGISIGALLGVCILFKVVKALLDYFSGG